MLINSYGVRCLVYQLFQRVIRSNVITMADSDLMKTSELRALFQRLQEAKKQAEVLKVEVASIKCDIEKFESHKCFEPLSRKLRVGDEDFTSLSSLITSDEDDFSPGVSCPKRAKYDFPKDGDYVVVYTDGACENNGTSKAKAGIGVWFSDNHPLNVSKPVTGRATNNVAEIQACICAVEIAKGNGINKLKIVTDSQFLINSMTKWIHGWKKKNWQLTGGKGDVKNKTDFQKLDRACQGLNIKWEHVAGHSGVEGNEKADQLAREGAKLYKAN